jgi:hypothetical protein
MHGRNEGHRSLCRLLLEVPTFEIPVQNIPPGNNPALFFLTFPEMSYGMQKLVCFSMNIILRLLYAAKSPPFGGFLLLYSLICR